MILGQFEAVIDEKKRCALPKKFRDTLGNSLIITKGLDNQLIVVSQKSWNTLLEGTEGKPFIQKDVRTLQRFLLGNAFEAELDSKGRFIIPEYLRTFAKLEQSVVFVGVGRFIEVWDKNQWEEYQEGLSQDQQIVDIAERLSGEDKND